MFFVELKKMTCLVLKNIANKIRNKFLQHLRVELQPKSKKQQ